MAAGGQMYALLSFRSCFAENKLLSAQKIYKDARTPSDYDVSRAQRVFGRLLAASTLSVAD